MKFNSEKTGRKKEGKNGILEFDSGEGFRPEMEEEEENPHVMFSKVHLWKEAYKELRSDCSRKGMICIASELKRK